MKSLFDLMFVDKKVQVGDIIVGTTKTRYEIINIIRECFRFGTPCIEVRVRAPSGNIFIFYVNKHTQIERKSVLR